MRNQNGFTLVEMIISLAILMAITGTIYPLFSSSRSLLDKHHILEEVLQNNRIVLRRLVREARYGKTVYNAASNLFEVGTLYLVNTDALEEKIRYRLVSGSLLKAVDSGLGYGTEVTMAEKVQSFAATHNATNKTITFQLTTSWNGKSYVSQSVARLRAP